MKNSTKWFTLFIILSLSLIGIIFIYSAFYSKIHLFWANKLVIKQLIFILLGTILYLIVVNFDYNIIRKFGIHLYVLGIIFLLLSFFVFKSYRGRWVKLGFFSFQSSEFMKLGFLLLLSHIFAASVENASSFNTTTYIITLLKTGLITFFPMIIVLKQPDLGTSLVFFAVWFIFLFFYNLNLIIIGLIFLVIGFAMGTIFYVSLDISKPIGILKYLTQLNILKIGLIIIISVGISLLIYFLIYFFVGKRINLLLTIFIFLMIIIGFSISKIGVNKLKPYQKKRILTFIKPTYDIRGAGWNVIQSRIAIGSGKFKGKGLFKGTQNKFNFLPERHTDFIFSLVSEEWGFIGAMLLLLLEFSLLFILLYVALKSNTYYGFFFSMGSFTIFSMHILSNIGMNLGVLPITGIPLPFVSYGGSFYLIGITILAINMNILKNSTEIRRVDLFL